MKKLQNSIQESTQNFDEHLKRLFERRVKAEMVVNQVSKSFTYRALSFMEPPGPLFVLRKKTQQPFWHHVLAHADLLPAPASPVPPSPSLSCFLLWSLKLTSVLLPSSSASWPVYSTVYGRPQLTSQLLKTRLEPPNICSALLLSKTYCN